MDRLAADSVIRSNDSDPDGRPGGDLEYGDLGPPLDIGGTTDMRGGV
jgi:hypothetical protein